MTWFFEKIYSDFLWRIKVKDRVIYLTFDDGPIPEITPWVLDILNQFKAKATFFCVGDNIKKYTGIFKKIVNDGHQIGNHTFHHLNSWKTTDEIYLEDFYAFEKFHKTQLFRPPYGRIKMKVAKEICKSHNIIMWSVLTRDYSEKVSPEKCLKISLNNTTSGSIVLFHDSIKAQKNLRYVLPKFLEHFSKLGYRFEAIP